MKKFWSRRAAFTLVELLVVIAIIGILVALLLPAVQAAREAARRTQCSNNLKQFGIAIHNYHDTYKTLPLAGANWGNPQIGWQVQILPFAEQGQLWDSLDMESKLPTTPVNGPAWDTLLPTPTNANRRARMIQVPYAKCPSDEWNRDPASFGWAVGSYSGSLGSQRTPSASGSCNTWMTPVTNYQNPGGGADHGNDTNSANISGLFGRLGPMINLASIQDGTSNTIAVGEVLPNCHDHTGGGWWHYNGMNNAHASTSVPINNMTTCYNSKKITNPNCTNPNNWNFSWGFRSRHPGGAQFVMGDASVRMISDGIDYRTYQALGGRADGLAVGNY
ncbi:MAG: DUF1559 domain-containing protein [Planctomycetota bacterium]